MRARISTGRTDEDRKPEGLYQRKLEGSSGQSVVYKTITQYCSYKTHTRNKQIILIHAQNKRNKTNTRIIYLENQKHIQTRNRQGGGAKRTRDRRPRPRPRQKERAHGKWVHSEPIHMGNHNWIKHKLAKAWTRTPPSGEPGDPRWRLAKLRTPSPLPEASIEEH